MGFKICTFCLLTCTTVWGQDLVTDRPDQTESAEVVGPGNIQIELGISHEAFNSNVDAQGFGEALARIGIGSKFELRLGFDGYGQVDGTVIDESGIGDSSIGFKWKIAEEEGARPQTALLMGTTLPTGDDQFTSDESEPSFRFNFSHTLSQKLSVAYNLGMASVVEHDQSGEHMLGVAQYTLTMGVGLNDQWGAFIEAFGDVPTTASGGPANSIDGGFTYLINPVFQWDIYGGFGLSDAASDWFAGMGISYRFDR